jgi:preprotein translocase subunit YajC
MDQATNPLLQLPIIPYLVIFAVFYFLVIKPQKDSQKKHQEMVNTLKKNDKVVTASGIHGTIVAVKEKTVVVRVDDNAKIEFDKEVVTVVEKAADA